MSEIEFVSQASERHPSKGVTQQKFLNLDHAKFEEREVPLDFSLATKRNKLKKDMIAAIPKLRAYAFSICRDQNQADDLVQETLIKAWASFDQFMVGTNLNAWLFTILRNTHHSEYRKKRREVEDIEGECSAHLLTPPSQVDHMDLLDLRRALGRLDVEQRDALILVGAAGYSYKEAALISDCAVGTIKSRVSRGRARLCDLLSVRPNVQHGGRSSASRAATNPLPD